MKRKLIFVLLDGLNNKQSDLMGYMNALVSAGMGKRGRVFSEMPSLSRPLYETLLTGKKPVEHEIVNNRVCRLSKEKSIFSLCKKNGLKTGAAAYYWVSELYNSAPFDRFNDTYTNDSQKNIEHGIFYTLDHYPDENVFLDGEYLRKRYDLDFLMIHSMNIDDEGHKHGAESQEYRNAIRNVDRILSDFIPIWIKNNYTIIVTADHGMSYDGNHSGIAQDEAEVPFWIVNDIDSIDINDNMQQIEIAKIMKTILKID